MMKSLYGTLLVVAIVAIPFAAWKCGGSASPGDPWQAEGPAGASDSLHATARPAHWGPPGFVGGPGRFDGPPQRGGLLPPVVQDRLNLTAEQRKQLEGLQQEAVSRLDQILTDEQRKQLRQMQQRFGPGGRGPAGPPG
jgi:hypothetical protein